MAWCSDIDWNATGSWMQAWAGFANAVVVGGAAWFGSKRLNDWLRERQVERKMAVGERLLTIAYKALDAFKGIRSPGSSGGETSAAQEKLQSGSSYNEASDREKRRMESAQIIIDRIFANKRLWDDYWENLPLCRAYYGNDIEESFRIIWQKRASVYSAAITYGSLRDGGDRATEVGFEEVFWEYLAQARNKPDPVNVDLDTMVQRLEAEILPLLGSSTSNV
ncbi:hypothetical protein [Caulobacter sp. NIBR2454]|uniref:hypothetical protein n=1 Tax=Caulobacter sp. NIBR2454 TaxID=3015996 RepID=UPI0022B72D29|nr:hypothetical protein [Caulobacter sp. NIBR2454]